MVRDQAAQAGVDITPLIEHQQRTNELLADLLAVMREQPKTPDSSVKNVLGNKVPKAVPKVPKSPRPVATPSKAELARQWFKQHPEDLEKPGRELEQSATPQGVSISYKYWNRIKKEFQ